MAGAPRAALNMPPTTEQAKQRLLAAAGEMGVGALVRRHPYGALAAALVGGMVLGRTRSAAGVSGANLVPLLLRLLR